MRLCMIWGTDYADQGGCYPPKTSVALILSSILLLRSLEPRIWLFPFRNACKNIPPKQLSSYALSDSDDLGQFLASEFQERLSPWQYFPSRVFSAAEGL